MSKHLKPPIFWHQGLFLEPQHFQHQDARLDAMVARHMTLTQPWGWGFLALEIDETALRTRTLALRRAVVRWQDGAFTEFPGNARCESRRFDLADFAQGPRTAYLGLRRLIEGEPNVLRYDTEDELATSHSRFAALAQPTSVPDVYNNGVPGQMITMDYVLRIFWDHEIEHAGEFELIPLAQLEQDGEGIRTVNHFTPPCMTIGASQPIMGWLQGLRDEVIGRARQLEVFKRPLSNRDPEDSALFGTVLALSVLNRYGIELSHLIEAPQQTHPWQAYGVLRQLVAELSTFTDYCDLLGETRKGESLILKYDHTDLGSVFHQMNTVILRLLNEITLGPEMFVRFERQSDTVLTANLPDTFFGPRHRYYLMVRSTLESDTLTQTLTLDAKLATSDTLETVVTRALPGIELLALQTLPLGLPKRNGATYFRIENECALWESVQSSGELALFLPDIPSDLQAELIMIKG